MLLVYTQQDAPRLQYALRLVLKHLLLVDFSVTHSELEFAAASFPKLSYGRDFGLEIPFIPDCGILWEKEITEKDIPVYNWEQLPVLFNTDTPAALLPFDIFGASFFLASRYEEYLPASYDVHKRYLHNNSLAYRHGFLNKPLLNLWAKELKKALQWQYPGLLFGQAEFVYLPTYDIDIAYAYKGRPASRHLLAAAKNMLKFNLKDLLLRWSVMTGFRKDPYDTYDLQDVLHTRYNLKARYFILSGMYGPYDKNLDLRKSAQQKNLVKNLAARYALGLHPSYASESKAEKIANERKLLERATGKTVNSSRQHFLKLSLPDTYRALIAAGITSDYSMAYPGHAGFRASICTPYPFYDLPAEQATALMIYPAAIMDNTLKDYMDLSPEKAVAYGKQLVDAARDVDGLFISIWHNHTLEDSGRWKGWAQVYEEIMRYAVNEAS